MKNLILLLLISVSFVFCKRSGTTTAEENKRFADSVENAQNNGQMSDNDMNDNDGDAIDPDKNAFVEFSITDGARVLRLRDQKQSVNLGAIGTPNDTLTRKMTLSSDTYKGSSVQEFKYDDINLEFFSPNANDNAWLMVIDVKGGPWSTARGIRVGDNVADLKKMYPNAINETDDTTLFTYRLGDTSLQFGTMADKVTRIRVEYHLP